MSEVIEIPLMILIGWVGIAIVSLFQIQGINDSNPNIDIKCASKMWLSHTLANTIASMLIVMVYSFTHEEWITLISSGAIPAPKLIQSIIGFVMIVSFFVGGACQYGIYKIWFRKIDLAMKRFTPKDS